MKFAASAVVVTVWSRSYFAPRIHHGIDLRNDARYFPHDDECEDQVVHTSAVDVGDRVVNGFGDATRGTSTTPATSPR